MQPWVAVMMVAAFGCYSVRSVQVHSSADDKGDECFAACNKEDAVSDDEVFACVSECDGAETADKECPDDAECVQVEERNALSYGLIVVGLVLIVVPIVAIASLAHGLNTAD